MFRNFIKIAWRNVVRNKVNAIINVAGLALGLTSCLFIYLWVQDEKGIDNFYPNKKNLYAIYTTTTSEGKTDGSYSAPIISDSAGLTPTFSLEQSPNGVPEIEHFAFYATGYELPWGHPETIQVGDKIVKLDGSRAGSDFFKIFNYPLIEGNAATALSQITSIAISRKMATIFFGAPANAIGKTVRYENRLNFIVSAVFEDLPQRSSLHFDFVLSMEAQKSLLEFASPNLYGYVTLKDNSDPRKVEAELNGYLKPIFEKAKNVKTRVGLQLVGDQYLHNIFVNGKPTTGRIEYVRIFSLTALFLLVIACINFMNLATARSVKRAKEVGLRKVVGSTRQFLVLQFLSESLLFAILAMFASLALVYLLLPEFNAFTGKNIALPLGQFSFWSFLSAIVIITGLLAGSYPAVYLSSLKPVRILKGKLQFTQGAVLFRKGLTVFQFVLSIVLIISTIVIARQIDFIQHSHLGFDRENLLYVRIEGNLSNKKDYLFFKEEASKMPGIAMIDRSTETPHDMNFVVTDPVNWEGKTSDDQVGFLPSSVGFDFIKLMKIPVIEGRAFSRDIATDSTDAFMINEEAVKQMGIKNPVGKWISAWNKKGHIIGVLKDYSTQSLREKIKPEVVDIKEGEYFGVVMIRTKKGETKQAIESLQTLYKRINPNYAFAYQFVEEEYEKLYSTEMITSKLSRVFAVLAIIISCLGLLGLAIFSGEQRTKEMGVRKVLGASVGQIISMFSTEFVKLVLIAFLIAAPVAGYLMNNWLRSFVYKVAMSWWIFLLAGCVSILIALLTVSWQALKSARTNPVNSLRSE